MDIEKFAQAKLIETRLKHESRIKSDMERIAEIEVEIKTIKNSNKIPETTDTLKKIECYNNHKVLIEYSINNYKKTFERVLKFENEKIANCHFSLIPLIPYIDKITDLRTSNVIYKNSYKNESLAMQTAKLLGKNAGIKVAQKEINLKLNNIASEIENFNKTLEASNHIFEWIERGNKIIYPQLKDEWVKNVILKTNDIFHGKNIEIALNAMESISKGSTLEEVFYSTLNAITGNVALEEDAFFLHERR